jgi:hypothetical protein
VKVWVDEVKANTPPTLYEVFTELADSRAGDRQSDYIKHIKLMSQTLMFTQQNNISDLPALADKVSKMHRDCEVLNANVKVTQRRIDTLNEHLWQSENYNKYRKITAAYDALYAAWSEAEKSTGVFAKSKAEKSHAAAQDFFRENEREIGMFRNAEKYLKGVLQKRFDPKKSPPIKMWCEELKEKLTVKTGLDREFHTLRGEIKHAETLKRFAVDLMLPEKPQTQQKTKALDVSL